MKKKSTKLIDKGKKKELKNELNILSKSTKFIDSKIQIDYELWKENYYKIKLKLDFKKKENHLNLVQNYIDGLFWNLKYYFFECPSWDWFFPYYYSPLLSDFEILDDEYEPIKFIVGEPIKPLEQLFSVLPPRSSYLLPKEFQYLFHHEKLKKFYPKDKIEIDSEYMKWEPIKILPFIDMNELKLVLREEIKNYDEKFENLNEIFHYSWKENEKYFFKSTLDRLSDID